MGLAQHYLEDIAKEQEGFRQVLELYFSNGQYREPRILSICSGVANEEPLLKNHFGENSELISLDNNPHLEIFWRELGRKSVQIRDVRELYKHVRGKFNLVVGRNVPLNPNYRSLMKKVPDCWPRVFEDLIEFMESDYTLFLTVVRGDEFDRAKEILDNTGYRIEVKERNQIVVPSDYIGIAGSDTKDHYVIVAQPPFKI
ncbi:MAG: hypothetical protein ACE5ES_03375 [Candidatus Nanoarchaeia archaeon]